jgi:hypothetical protein
VCNTHDKRCRLGSFIVTTLAAAGSVPTLAAPLDSGQGLSSMKDDVCLWRRRSAAEPLKRAELTSDIGVHACARRQESWLKTMDGCVTESDVHDGAPWAFATRAIESQA